MALKLRLQRHGRKRRPYYHIVAADARAPRDGRIVERIGAYNPNTNPATIDLNFDKALSWIQKGAQPSDTVRAILSYKGVMHMNHLLKGVNKGAHTEEEAQAKFQAWMNEQQSRIEGKKTSLAEAKAAAAKEAQEREAKVRETMAAEIAAKNNPIVEEVEAAVETEATAEAEVEAPAVEEAPEAPAAEEATEATTEVEVEAPAAEETAEAAPEAEAEVEAPAEEAAPIAEAETEAPAEEAADASEEDAKTEEA